MGRTLLSKPSPLVHLEILLVTLFLHRSIAPRFSIIQLHRLIEQLKSLHFFNCLSRGFYGVENDKGLTFGFQIGFGDEVDYFAIFGEDFGQSFFELVAFDTLF